MKLFKLTQDAVDGYDTYDSCIVCAESKEDAIKISPSGWDGLTECPTEESHEDYSYSGWCTQKDVQCEYLGEAKEGLKRGVICSSFNAG